MNLKHLTYIVTIAEMQSISKAAEILFLSRPALNHFLLNLEKELGFSLFKRINKKLILTDAGRIYVDSAKSILEIKKQTYKLLEELSDCETGCLHIGLTRGIGIHMFSEVFPIFHKKYPNFTVQLQEGNVRYLEDCVSNGIIDIAVIGQGSVHSHLQHLTFAPCEVVIVLPRSHPLAHLAAPVGMPHNPLDLRLLEKEAFVLMNKDTNIRAIADAHFQQANFEPKILTECSLSSLAYQLVRKGVAPSILMEHSILDKSSVACFSLTPKEIWSQSIAFRKGTVFTKAEQYFIQLVQEYFTHVTPLEMFSTNSFQV